MAAPAPRRSFIVPSGSEAVRDADGRATGALRPAASPRPGAIDRDPPAARPGGVPDARRSRPRWLTVLLKPFLWPVAAVLLFIVFAGKGCGK